MSSNDAMHRLEAKRVVEERLVVEDKVRYMVYSLDVRAKKVNCYAAHKVAEILEGQLSAPEPDTSVSSLVHLLGQVSIDDDFYGLVMRFKEWVTKPSAPLSEDQIHSQFRDFVLYVMSILKGLRSEWFNNSQCRLLLPYSGSGRFRPKDSAARYELNQALLLRPWGIEIGNGVDDPLYTDMLAIVQIMSADTQSSSDSDSNDEESYSPLKTAQMRLVQSNPCLYDNQHNRMFTWGLTVCESLVRIYHFGPDCILSSEDMDMTTAVGRYRFIDWLAALSLGDEDRRGFMPSLTFVGEPSPGYWVLRTPKLDDNGNETGEDAVFYSRQPSVKAFGNFGCHTRGFPVSASLETVDTPDLFVKVGWSKPIERVAGSTDTPQNPELEYLKRIKKEYEKSGDASIHVPLLVAGGVMTTRANGAPVQMTTDPIYGTKIIERLGVIDDDAQAAAGGSKPPQ
ncbi:hypothetical protein GGI09_004786 [Coemansia sp. S100]|nr:hypothetical protein LPJ71_000638 [Coemansia sp. S17]KAJ2095605.1 hypothetical protein GGI09_004786 [Coemansia sp. S100]